MVRMPIRRIFKNRLFKNVRPKKEIQFIKSRFQNGSDNFRRNWFCKSCHHIFHLKPRRKYKALLKYDLSCQNCQSTNIIHGEQLSNAIRNGIPVSEIAELFGKKNSEMEFSLTNKSTYYPMVTGDAQTQAVNKEYFLLE
jgi:hypothetical protein